MRVRVFDSSYKALPAGVLGRLVVAVRRFRWTWIKQRWMRAEVSQVLFRLSRWENLDHA